MNIVYSNYVALCEVSYSEPSVSWLREKIHYTKLWEAIFGVLLSLPSFSSHIWLHNNRLSWAVY